MILLFVSLSTCCSSVNSNDTCKNEIAKFSNAADIDASATEVNVGDTLTITCSTKCGWHLYYLNTNALNINFLNTGNINTTFQQKNQLMNCTDCDNQNQLDCSQNYKGPIQSTLNLTLYSSGTYYIQCLSHLFANSDYWPSQLFYVYSKVVKITAKEEYVEVSRSPTSHLPFPSSTTLDLHSYEETNKTPDKAPVTSVITRTNTPDKVTVTSVITRTTTTVVSIIATTACNSISIRTSVIKTPTFEDSAVAVEPTVDAVAGQQCTSFDTTQPIPLIIVAVLGSICILCFAIIGCLVCFIRKHNHHMIIKNKTASQDLYEHISTSSTQSSPRISRLITTV